MTARWKKELRKTADQETDERMAKMVPPPPTDPPKVDPTLPASMQPGNDRLAFFWIGYFAFFLIVVPVLMELL